MGSKTIQSKLLVELDRPASTRPIVAAKCSSIASSRTCTPGARVREASDRPETKRAACGGSVFIKGFDLPTPSFMLAIVDLAEIQHLALHRFTAVTSLVLDNIPIAMLFAVFEASIEAQEHANQFSPNKIDQK